MLLRQCVLRRRLVGGDARRVGGGAGWWSAGAGSDPAWNCSPAHLPSSRLIRFTSAGEVTTSWESRRDWREVFSSNLWTLLACSRMTLPLPLMRNRFLVPLWVFIFGMAAVLLVVWSGRWARILVHRGRPSAEGTVHPAVGRGRVCGRDRTT